MSDREIRLRGNYTHLVTQGAAFAIVPTPGIDPSTGVLYASDFGADAHTIWAGYYHLSPIMEQPGTNLAGDEYAWNRIYSSRIGRWTTPDPAATPWTNLQDYVGVAPLGIADPSGLGYWKCPWRTRPNCHWVTRTNEKPVYGGCWFIGIPCRKQNKAGTWSWDSCCIRQSQKSRTSSGDRTNPPTKSPAGTVSPSGTGGNKPPTSTRPTSSPNNPNNTPSGSESGRGAPDPNNPGGSAGHSPYGTAESGKSGDSSDSKPVEEDSGLLPEDQRAAEIDCWKQLEQQMRAKAEANRQAGKYSRCLDLQIRFVAWRANRSNYKGRNWSSFDKFHLRQLKDRKCKIPKCP